MTLALRDRLGHAGRMAGWSCWSTRDVGRMEICGAAEALANRPRSRTGPVTLDVPARRASRTSGRRPAASGGSPLWAHHGCGASSSSCSKRVAGRATTKHATPARVSPASSISTCSSCSGSTEMAERNTPGSERCLSGHGLTCIPEAHRYLRCEGERGDRLTGSPERGAERGDGISMPSAGSRDHGRADRAAFYTSDDLHRRSGFKPIRLAPRRPRRQTLCGPPPPRRLVSWRSCRVECMADGQLLGDRGTRHARDSHRRHRPGRPRAPRTSAFQATMPVPDRHAMAGIWPECRRARA